MSKRKTLSKLLPITQVIFCFAIAEYDSLFTVRFANICRRIMWLRNNCKAWSRNYFLRMDTCSRHSRVVQSRDSWSGHKNDSRGNSRASAKQLSHNKSCRFQLEYIDMQPNHTLSIANIVENRYTWTELPDMERAFHSRQISETRSKSRRHESELWRWQ